MSGLGNFGLSSLGSMSTLGSLAQSAQRLDRLMAGNRSRQEGSEYGRNNSRRSMDNDFFGGRSDRSRRRSPSPPRRFNHDDRRSLERRDRGNQRRSLDDDMYGSAGGAGILGAAPSRNDRPSGNSGLGGDAVGSTWNDGSAGPGLNINSQTQQLLNMMQTQQLLAAVQAQAKLANQTPPSLMGSSPYPRQGGRMMNARGGRFNRNDRPGVRPGGFNRRDDRKRRVSPPPRPFKRERRDGNTARKVQGAKKTTTGDKNVPKKDTKQPGKETKTKPQAKDVESKERKQESSETETKIKTNAADEDIEELMKTNFDGKRYWCTLCKIVCLKSKNIYKHLLSERHVKAAIEKQGKVFDPEIMKKQEPKKEVSKDISEVLKYVCSTKQMARKQDNDIYISSLTDCTVKITDFTTEQDFMGSEFVKAVSGFKCQLCKTFMRHGHQIIEHLKGRKHNANYEAYLSENPDYLINQRDVNKNLVDMLQKDEGKDVVLQESNGEAHKADDVELSSSTLEEKEEEDLNVEELEPDESSRADEDSKMADESALDDSVINDSSQEYAVEDSEAEAEKSKMEEDGEKSEPEENEDEKEAQKKEEKTKSEVEEPSKENETESMEADEEEEEFPLLEPPVNVIKDDTTEPEDETKMPGLEEKDDIKPEEQNTPEVPDEPADEPEEVEEVTPSRRGRRAKRGRGATKASRGRRRTPRAAKNAKKAEEVVEPEEEKEDVPAETEREPEPAVPAVEEDPAEDLPSSQEVTSSQESKDAQGIDGFEVIDEVEGGEESGSEDDD